MLTSFLKHRKKQFSRMRRGAFCVLACVENFRFISPIVAYTISEFFVFLQIVKQFLFNIGLSVVANTLKPLRDSKLLSLFIFNKPNLC